MTHVPTDNHEIFITSQALLNGHFKLSSGKHSDQYLQCARALQFPRYARVLGQRLADLFKDIPFDGVIAPAIGGILVTHEVASASNVRGIFCERKDGEMTLRRGFEIKEKERFLIVEDVITTGKSTREVIALVDASGGLVAGIGSLANRSSGSLDLPVEPRSLITLDVMNWDPDDCPLCRKQIPLESPGSRFTAQR